MFPGSDGSATEALRPSFAPIANWILRLVLTALGLRDANYLLLSPPFLSRQIVHRRGVGRTHTLSLADARDCQTLVRVFGDEAYRVDRLARGDDLMAAYRRMIAAGATPLILDCGADAGYASRYFAEAFPKARVIGIEPSRLRYLRAVDNCAGANVTIRQAAVACECGPTDADDVPRLSINSLVSEHCAEGAWPFLLRLDIEAFEEDLFSSNAEWVDEFPLLIVEAGAWRFPSRPRSRSLLRTLAGGGRDFVFVDDCLFSIANDAATTAARQIFSRVPRGVAPYHPRAAAT
jgi:hypothetical protein